jgi:hypothetical protein
MAEGSAGAADAGLGYDLDAVLERHRRDLRRSAPRAITVENLLTDQGSPTSGAPHAAFQTSLRRAQPMIRHEDPRRTPAHAARTTRRTTDGV